MSEKRKHLLGYREAVELFKWFYGDIPVTYKHNDNHGITVHNGEDRYHRKSLEIKGDMMRFRGTNVYGTDFAELVDPLALADKIREIIPKRNKS